MAYCEALVAGKLRRWEKYLENYHLPQWDELPDFGLYMEQVIALLKGYLDYLPPELKDEQFITAATVNNYVRNKIMPGPVKKRYYRVHLAYLVMICTLKQSLPIATLQSIIPHPLPEGEVRGIYDAYVLRHRDAAAYFLSQVRQVAGPILGHEAVAGASVPDTGELIAAAAIISGLSRLLAEKLLLLEGKTLTDGGAVLLPEGEGGGAK